MKFSHGDALTAGSSNTILDVPDGYDAVVTYLFISNTTGSSKSLDARWVHNSVNIDFLSGKNVNSGEFLVFGGQFGELSGLYVAPEFYQSITAPYKLKNVAADYVLSLFQKLVPDLKN